MHIIYAHLSCAFFMHINYISHKHTVYAAWENANNYIVPWDEAETEYSSKSYPDICGSYSGMLSSTKGANLPTFMSKTLDRVILNPPSKISQDKKTAGVL